MATKAQEAVDRALDPLLTPQTLADRYELPLNTIYAWRSKGTGPRGIRIGRHLRFQLSEVIRWEQAQTDPRSA